MFAYSKRTIMAIFLCFITTGPLIAMDINPDEILNQIIQNTRQKAGLLDGFNTRTLKANIGPADKNLALIILNCKTIRDVLNTDFIKKIASTCNVDLQRIQESADHFGFAGLLDVSCYKTIGELSVPIQKITTEGFETNPQNISNPIAFVLELIDCFRFTSVIQQEIATNLIESSTIDRFISNIPLNEISFIEHAHDVFAQKRLAAAISQKMAEIAQATDGKVYLEFFRFNFNKIRAIIQARYQYLKKHRKYDLSPEELTELLMKYSIAQEILDCKISILDQAIGRASWYGKFLYAPIWQKIIGGTLLTLAAYYGYKKLCAPDKQKKEAAEKMTAKNDDVRFAYAR